MSVIRVCIVGANNAHLIFQVFRNFLSFSMFVNFDVIRVYFVSADDPVPPCSWWFVLFDVLW
jgi:hypothetical protein